MWCRDSEPRPVFTPYTTSPRASTRSTTRRASHTRRSARSLTRPGTRSRATATTSSTRRSSPVSSITRFSVCGSAVTSSGLTAGGSGTKLITTWGTSRTATSSWCAAASRCPGASRPPARSPCATGGSPRSPGPTRPCRPRARSTPATRSCSPGPSAAKAADIEREAHVDVALWATGAPAGPLDDVQALVDAGACAFKLSTYDTDPRRFPRIPDDRLLASFAAIAAAGGLAGVHSENDEIVRPRVAALRAAGRGDAPAHAESRPAVAETEAIGRCLELARATGVRLHLCHVTVGRGVELARRARADGVDLTLEACAHHPLLH